MRLKQLLAANPIGTAAIEAHFERIAKKLLTEYEIQKGEATYQILEIECYYYTKEHEDIITYPRKIEEGIWFFHSSGVDITFASQCSNVDTKESERKPNNDYFGGILIRSISKGKKLFCGPMNCTNELFDQFHALEAKQEEYPIIAKKESASSQKVYKTKRYINLTDERIKNRFGENEATFREFKEKEYRYFIELEKGCDKSRLSKYAASPWKESIEKR